MSRTPLVSRDVFNLANVPGGLRPGTISFRTVTMQSDKFVCVRDQQQDGQTSVVVADMARLAADRVTLREADAVIVHPSARVMAVRVGSNIVVVKIDERSKVKDLNFQFGNIVYWTWANSTTLAIVTDSAVYHWSVDPNNAQAPQKIFDRDAQIADAQILSYKFDSNNKWFMICGVLRTDAGLVGKAQLFSAENNASRVIDGHSGCFAPIPASKADPRECNVLCLASGAGNQARIMIMELPSSLKADATFERRNFTVDIEAGDFPVACHVSPKHRLLTVVTSRGKAFLIDPRTGTVICQESVSNQQLVIFCGVPYEKTGGLMLVSSTGSILHVSIDDDTICRYVNSALHNPDLAVRIATDAGLGGADELFRSQFQSAVARGDVESAIQACISAPRNSLRTAETLRMFSNMPSSAGGSPPISQYFKAMLAQGKLTGPESEELGRVVLPKPNGWAYVKQQLDEEKLEESETLADLISQHDQDAAMKMYFKVKAHAKVVNILLTRNETQKAVEYCRRVEYNPDWRVVLQNFIRVNATDAVNLAIMLHNELSDKPVLDPIEVVDMFLPGQNIRPATKFIVDVIQGPRVGTYGPSLQTKLLEINLKHSPADVAERIFGLPYITEYDPVVIAPLCERAGLFQHALECYRRIQVESHFERNMMTNIKRCIASAAAAVPLEWLVDFVGKLRCEDMLDCVKELMKNHKANFKAIVQIAVKYNDAIGSQSLIKLFLEPRAFDVLYYYLGAVVGYSRDPELHFRYIEAACEVNQIAEVERMTRESPCYEPERTKNYLKEKRLDDLWPFMNVCDKHGFINEMIKYLLDTNNESYIEQYVQRRNPQKTPQVVGALMDFDSAEKHIHTVLQAAGSMCPVDELISEVEHRGRLRMLRSWLEGRAAERKTDPAIYNALAKIYVEQGDSNAETFLLKNEFYDSGVVGEFCESRDPLLAYAAYKRGNCHRPLIQVCIKNGLWKQLAKHLVALQSVNYWMEVLKGDHSEHLSTTFIDAVRTETAESSVADEVIVTVRAFTAAGMTKELTTILDQVVLSGKFQRNKYLENLLITNAIKSRPEKVSEYLNKLEDYDPNDIAPTAIEHMMFDAAFTVYNKAGMKKQAVIVLLDHMHDVGRARTYAQDSKLPEVYTELGRYLLTKDELSEAVEALIAAKNPDFVPQAVAAADRINSYGDLIKYLMMARKERKSASDQNIDTYLVLTYAKTGRMAELEEFLKANTHGVQILQVAEKCFNDGLFDSARALFLAASNFPRLASTLVRLKNYTAAVEAAEKAQSVRTWKDVMVACIEAKELPLAQICAVHLVLVPEELAFTARLYEKGGLIDEAINVMKVAMSNNNAHKALFTELASFYARYKPDSLLEHIRLYSKKLNSHAVMNVCKHYHHWMPLRVLHIANEDWLGASQVMMEHPADCWEHELFKETIVKMGTSDVCYSSIGFYLKHAPGKLHDFLMTVAKKVDSERVMTEVKKGAPLSFIRKFLESTQDRNVRRVNDALNAMYVEEDDFNALRRSVDNYNNFDSAELSASLEQLPLFEFRKIALTLHRRNKRFSHAIEVAKANNLFSEAIESAAESKDHELAEKLLVWFVAEKKRPDCFIACLYQCYDLVTPAFAMELGWRYGMMNAVMPFMIQSMTEMQERISSLEKAMSDAQKQAKEQASHQATMQQHGAPNPLMITGPALASPGAHF